MLLAVTNPHVLRCVSIYNSLEGFKFGIYLNPFTVEHKVTFSTEEKK